MEKYKKRTCLYKNIAAMIILILISCPIRSQSLIKDTIIWDLELLKKVPQVKWIDQQSTVYSFLYSGLRYKGNPTESFAYYSNPDILEGKNSKRKFPAVVLVHGGGGTAFREWVEKWAAEGYAAIAMDLSGRDGNGKKLMNAGPDQADSYKFEEIDRGPVENVWNYHAVANVILAHSWLRSRPEIDIDNTFITGISWGGYLTCIAASLDNRFKAAAPIYGCGYFAEMDTFGQRLNSLSSRGKSLWIRYFDASAYLSIANIPFLFVNGNKDRHFGIISYHQSYNLLPEGNRYINIIPNMKHGHYEGWMPHETRFFFDHFVYENGQLPSLRVPTIYNCEISVEYESPVQPFEMKFYYSNDSISSNEQRNWKVVSAMYDAKKKKIYCQMPQDEFWVAFFYVRDHRNITASSEFIFRKEL